MPWFHRTTPDRLERILKGGLLAGSESNLTDAGAWSFEIYGHAPVFIAQTPDTVYAAHAPTLLLVEISSIPIVADLPSLVDHGAYYDLDEGVMWWKASSEEFSFDELLTPGGSTCVWAIEKTATAACLGSIPPSALRLINYG